MKSKSEIKTEQDAILLEIGKEGKEGDKAFGQYAKEKDKESKKKRDKVLELINDQPKKVKTYNSFLADILYQRLHYVDWEPGWKFYTGFTDKGVVMELKSPDNRIFRSAFKPTADPILDLNAIDNFALRAENMVDAFRYKIIK